MKKLITPLFLSLCLLLSSCDAIVGIFKAGAAVGIFTVIVVIAVIIWVISLFRGRSN
ncbi:uncharacterized membrane protein YtjA (UPF0391 family) [Mucilaginibacter rubeus]|uniref:hypothetical protein n=1 Tax=Mucilaginibacter rubeus TaxID=2027860 RepID=UPI0033994DA0